MGDLIGEERTWFSLEVFRAFLSHVDDQMMLDNHFPVYLILFRAHRNPPRDKRVVFFPIDGWSPTFEQRVISPISEYKSLVSGYFSTTILHT